MLKQLWAPWRLSYVTKPKPDGCVFCAKPLQPDAESYIVARGEHAYVVLNLYPYNSGHLLVVPFRHVADLLELTDEESNEINQLLRDALKVVRTAFSPDGANIGINLGDAAGAGIAQHLHWHIVPRWSGDTNFLPVLAETNVISQTLGDTHTNVSQLFSDLTNNQGASHA